VPGTLLVVLSILLLPVPALAFGPIAHLDMGLDLLGSAGLFAAGVARLVRRHPAAFLRGTLDPDRSLAKNLAPYPRHSHNWDHAFAQFRTARDGEEQAAFLGYLSHLAADAVAHNAFVPSRLVAAWRHPAAGHLYWEVRYDAHVRRRTGPALLWMANPGDPDHRRFLDRTVRPSLPGRGIQVRLTEWVLRIQRGWAYGDASDRLDRGSRLDLDEAEVLRVRSLALAAQRDLLANLDAAAVLCIDPTGLDALRLARQVRRDARALHASGDPGRADFRLAEARRHFEGLVVSLAPCAGDVGLTPVPRAAILAR